MSSQSVSQNVPRNAESLSKSSIVPGSSKQFPLDKPSAVRLPLIDKPKPAIVANAIVPLPKTMGVEVNSQATKRKIVEGSPRTTNVSPMAVTSTMEIRRSPAISHEPVIRAENEHELLHLVPTTSNKRQTKSELDVIFAMVQEEFSNYK